MAAKEVLPQFGDFEEFVRSLYSEDFIHLHRPVFQGNEKKYLSECIDSNFVSSVGEQVNSFEQKIASFTGAKYAIAAVNGTAALHVALQLAGVMRGEEVITQALTFIATCSAISYRGAFPVFIDIDRSTMGMSAQALKVFFQQYAEIKNGKAFNKKTGRRISACVPMHTFGHPCDIGEIVAVCEEYNIPVVEDAAESLGSYRGKKHTGTFGLLGVLSFNGNKIITTGGGGMILTDSDELALRAKHLTTTAKISHPYEYAHDAVAYNYRMPNINAALGCAQLERISEFLLKKREVARKYRDFFSGKEAEYVIEPDGCSSNYWLNTVLFSSRIERDQFLEFTNANGIGTRPVWRLMSELEMFKDCQNDGLANSRWVEDRAVNLPSSVPN